MSIRSLCPAGCGEKYISAEHAERHADAKHPGWREPKPHLQRGWATPHGFVDFSKPIPYDEACKVALKLQESTR